MSFDGANWVNLDGSDAIESDNNAYPWYQGSEPNGQTTVAFLNVPAVNGFGLAAGIGWADLNDPETFWWNRTFFVEHEVPAPATLLLLLLASD